MIIITFLFYLVIETESVYTTPLSYFDYKPSFMEASKIGFVKGIDTDEDPSTNFLSFYTVSFERIQKTASTPYLLVIGFKMMQIDLAPSPNYSQNRLYVAEKNETNFVCGAKSDPQAYLIRFQASYIAISKNIGNIYYFNFLITVNQALVWNNKLDFDFTDTSIDPTGGPYRTITSITRFRVAQTSGSTSQTLLVNVVVKTANDYQINFYSNGLFVENCGIQGLIISQSLMNNQKLKNVMLVSYYQHQTQGFFDAPILSYPGVVITTKNVFFGLHYFWSNAQKYNIQLNVSNSEIYLYKRSSVSYMAVHIIVFFGNNCQDPYFYDQKEQICQRCVSYCDSCDDFECFQCATNFTLSADKKSCECQNQLVSGICYAFDSSKMKGCLSAIEISNNITCRICSVTQNLILFNNECICKSGYRLGFDGKCAEICGDGLLFFMECDDGNLINGDGCSDTCAVEKGFICEKQGISRCKYVMDINFRLLSIIKNRNNSAVLKLESRRVLPFRIQYDELVDSKGNQRINMTVNVDGISLPLKSRLISVNDNELTLLIEYDFTIECLPTTMNLDLIETIFTPEKSQLEFYACGDNEPLIISHYSEVFLKGELAFIGVGAVVMFLLGIGLFTPKFIGIEAISTLQLIYYSCFLVTDIQNYPVGFKTFTTFKYSTGYNEFFNYTGIFFDKDFSKKVIWMGLKKTIIQNYNLSFVFFLFSSILFLCTSIYRQRAQQVFQQRSPSETSSQIKQYRQTLKKSLRFDFTAYNLISHIVVWSILQIMAALFLEIQVSNKSMFMIFNGKCLPFRGLIGIITTFLIGIIGGNNFNNVLLSQITWGKILQKPQQLQYRKANFIYMIVMGLTIFSLNQILFFEMIPASALALFIHIVYVISLIKIQPYKQSLNVHKYGLFWCQFVYLVFLIVVNVINFIGIKNEIVSLIIVYFILLACGFIILFTIIRLYYEYRYGAELQRKIQKQRQLQMQFEMQKQQQELKRIMKNFENNFKKNLDQNQINRLQNRFLYENQIRQALMNQQINFLGNRPNLSQQKKEVYYFQKFHTKPMNWLKINDPQQFQKRLAQIQAKKAVQKEKKSKAKETPEYKALTSRLRKQFVHFTRLQKNKQQIFRLTE